METVPELLIASHDLHQLMELSMKSTDMLEMFITSTIWTACGEIVFSTDLVCFHRESKKFFRCLANSPAKISVLLSYTYFHVDE